MVHVHEYPDDVKIVEFREDEDIISARRYERQKKNGDWVGLNLPKKPAEVDDWPVPETAVFSRPPRVHAFAHSANCNAAKARRPSMREHAFHRLCGGHSKMVVPWRRGPRRFREMKMRKKCIDEERAAQTHFSRHA